MSLLIVFQLRTGDQPQVEVGDASSLSGAASRNGMARTKLPGYLRSAWFQQMLQLSFVGGLTGEYVDFHDRPTSGSTHDCGSWRADDRGGGGGRSGRHGAESGGGSAGHCGH